MKRLLHYQILAFITLGKILKAHTITINLRHQHLQGMMNLNYHMDLILYQIFKNISNIFKKSMVKILIIHQYKYMLIKLKMGLHLKLKKDIVLNF